MKQTLKNLALAGTMCLAGACGNQKPSTNSKAGTLKVSAGTNTTSLTSSSAASCYTATIQVYSDNGDGNLVPFGSAQTLTAGPAEGGVVQAVLACDTTASTGNAVVVMTLASPPNDCIPGDPSYDVLEGDGPFSAQEEVPCNAPSSGIESNVSLNLPLTVINQSVGDNDVTASVEVNQISESMKIPDCKPFLNDGNVNSILNALAIEPGDAPIQPGLFDLRYEIGFDGVTQVSADPNPTERWIDLQSSQLYSYSSAIAAPAEHVTDAAPTASLRSGAAFFDMPSEGARMVADGTTPQPGQFLEAVPMAVAALAVNEDGTCQGSDDPDQPADQERGVMRDGWIGGDTQAATTVRDSGDGYKLVCHCGSSNMNLTASCGAANAWDCYPGGQTQAAAFCNAGCGGATVIPDTGNSACNVGDDQTPCPLGGGVAFVATISTKVASQDGVDSRTNQSLNIIYAVDAALYEPIFDTNLFQNEFGPNEQVAQILNCSSNFVPVGQPPSMKRFLALTEPLAVERSGGGSDDFVEQPDTFLGVVTFTPGAGYNYYTVEIPADGVTPPIFQVSDVSMVDSCD